MNDKFIVLSDIHGNLSAIEAVIQDIEDRKYNPDGIIILGDNVNYGMRPNDVIERLIMLGMKYGIPVNLFGNHEKALIDGDSSAFSTERGKQILNYTRSILTSNSWNYIYGLTHSGFSITELGGKKCLFVHGSFNDPFWGKLNEDSVKEDVYSSFDYVFSGHSHIPHLIEHFYPTDNPRYRNKKKTIFINPGSVGQPRNHNPRAQYVYVSLRTEEIIFNSVEYDVICEQNLFPDHVDVFYKDRLIKGI